MTTRRIVLDTGVYLLILLRLNTTTHLKYFHLLQSLNHHTGERKKKNGHTEYKFYLQYNNNRSRCAKPFTSCSTYPLRWHVYSSCMLNSNGVHVELTPSGVVHSSRQFSSKGLVNVIIIVVVA